MTVLVIEPTRGGGRVRATITTDSNKIIHDNFYGSINDAIWYGLWFAIKLVDRVDHVVVDGVERRPCEVIDELWAFIDGISGGGNPSLLNTIDDMIFVLDR